jgi:hypothetical protein
MALLSMSMEAPNWSHKILFQAAFKVRPPSRMAGTPSIKASTFLQLNGKMYFVNAVCPGDEPDVSLHEVVQAIRQFTPHSSRCLPITNVEEVTEVFTQIRSNAVLVIEAPQAVNGKKQGESLLPRSRGAEAGSKRDEGTGETEGGSPGARKKAPDQYGALMRNWR